MGKVEEGVKCEVKNIHVQGRAKVDISAETLSLKIQ
jgi:hypothetical protein